VCSRLSGKVAIVTGAASGVGASAVALFAAEGARVIAGDTRGSALREAHPGEARGVTLLEADVTRPGECDALVRTALDAHGRVDVLFNNAGETIRGTLEDCGAVLPVDGGRQAAGPGTTVAVAAENGPGAEA
jgi:NAD(P)-dependent dehydrogenase (short-subunit alcohol dehydrogenase family)